MNKGSYVFSQMVKALDEFVFLRIVKKYDGDKYVKHFYAGIALNFYK